MIKCIISIIITHNDFIFYQLEYYSIAFIAFFTDIMPFRPTVS